MVNEISREDFFYVLKDNYDEHIELAIPFYREMHGEIARFVPEKATPLRALDLGCGTGKTSAAILHNFPASTVLAVDLFEEMLRHARTRLARFEGRVQYVQGDFRSLPLGSGYDVCVSALAIHHHTPEEKRETFKRIADALVPGGRFIMIDWTRFESPLVQRVSAAVAEQHAASSVPDEEVVKAWCEHWRDKNIPDTVENLVEWLMAAGFSHAECIVRYYGMAMIVAEKAS
jgi:tRNA (cmo5U34)-methyltransferase